MADALLEPPPLATIETIADLLERLGDVPPSRVRFRPVPGTATEQDVIEAAKDSDRLPCELIDGVLVEKAMGYEESVLAMLLGYFLIDFTRPRDLGIVAGADGFLRLMPGSVRVPDVSFVSWDRLPSHECPEGPIPDLVPDLAIEVLSASNTAKEMARKLRDYFASGVRLVWYVDPVARTVRVYTGVNESRLLHETDTLDGGDVLPGFALPLAELFPTVR